MVYYCTMSTIDSREYLRRIVYINDEDWLWVRKTALDLNVTASALIRASIRIGRRDMAVLKSEATGDSDPFYSHAISSEGAERAILKGVEPDD